ncbi:hypothetical protein N9L06_05775 [Mariniblastus sp.]|nr:hypothetical protein [Mariniblastus sp.]
MQKSAEIKNRRTHRAATNRHGSSLIEVIVMASVTSMMLVMVTAWIHQTMKQSARFRTERREQQAVSQLSQHFREHVWLSSNADLPNMNTVLLSNPQGAQFTYLFKDQQIYFAQLDASGITQALERFVLPVSSNVTFNLVNDSTLELKIETSIESKSSETAERDTRIYQIIKPTLARWLPKPTSPTSDSRNKSSSTDKESSE